MQEGLKAAAMVPLATADACLAAMQLARAVAPIGNPNSLSDAAVGIQVAFAGLRGGLWNVLINLKDVTDPAFVSEKRAACDKRLREARALAEEASAYVDERLAAMIDRR